MCKFFLYFGVLDGFDHSGEQRSRTEQQQQQAKVSVADLQTHLFLSLIHCLSMRGT